MKKAFQTLFTITVLALLMNCKTEAKKPAITTDKKVETTELKGTDREPTDDEIREYGIIKSIEDGQYPMFVVTVEFPERQTKASFNLNMEAVSQTAADIDSLIGNYASIYYIDSSDNMLMDIHFEGKTLYGEYAPEIDASFKKITGILSGAENETVGDLPTTIYITDANGNKMAFEEFITSKVVAKNGKTVTGYYYMRFNNIITYIKKSKD
jgi:hypothetical protein